MNLNGNSVTVKLFILAFHLLLFIEQPEAKVSTKAPAKVEERLEQIRKLSKEAGFPQRNVTEKQNVTELCLSDECLEAALYLVSAMNGSVDPCVDFYQFACGGFIASNPVPPSETIWNNWSAMRANATNITLKILREPVDPDDPKPVNQVKQYFKMCMDLEAIEKEGLGPLKETLKEIVGGWPLLNPKEWNQTGYDWLKAIANLRRRTQQLVVFAAVVEPDNQNTTRSAIQLDQPLFGISGSILNDPENHSGEISAYKTYIVEVAQELGSVLSPNELSTAAEQIIWLETEISRYASGDAARLDVDRMHNTYLLHQYQNETDHYDPERKFTINWKTYLDQLFTDTVSIEEDEFIIVKELDFFRNLVPLLKRVEKENLTTLANYIGWRLALGLISDTTQAMENITLKSLKFKRATNGAEQPPSRESSCISGANQYFGMAIGVKYVDKYFDHGTKPEMEKMSENIRLTFREMLEEAAWMRNGSRKEAVEKLDRNRRFLAHPDWLDNKTAVEEYFAGIELDKDGSYFRTQLNLKGYYMLGGMLSLRNPVNQNSWIVTPTTTDAFYMHWLNTINFPAGILQPPFFGRGRPKHQNYGAMGYLVGHELTHGFDSRGHLYDKDNNAKNWWDGETLAEFQKGIQCVQDQYSKYKVKEVDMNVNGEYTLSENVADNGGVKQSFRAYRKWVEKNGPEKKLPGLEHLSSEQLFFVGFANVWCQNTTIEGHKNAMKNIHAPTEWRIKGSVRNFKDFAEVYNCPVDSNGMNPPNEERCTVW